MSQEINAKEYFKGIHFQDRVCVPVFERIKHLYALGYTNGQITDTIMAEFEDIDPHSISTEDVKKVIQNNRPQFDDYRMELSQACAGAYKSHTLALFELTQKNELRVVESYNRKITEALDELERLSLGEQDEKKNYLNTSRIFVLMEFIEKFHKKCSEFIGTGAMREVEIYRQKMELKTIGDNNKQTGLTPKYTDTQSAVPTKFLG